MLGALHIAESSHLVLVGLRRLARLERAGGLRAVARRAANSRLRTGQQRASDEPGAGQACQERAAPAAWAQRRAGAHGERRLGVTTNGTHARILRGHLAIKGTLSEPGEGVVVEGFG
jgi:hypothetical protein